MAAQPPRLIAAAPVLGACLVSFLLGSQFGPHTSFGDPSKSLWPGLVSQNSLPSAAGAPSRRALGRESLAASSVEFQPAGGALNGGQGSARRGELELKRFSEVAAGNLLPGFLFLQGESDGLSQAFSINTGGGRGKAIPFVPDDSCDAAIFEGASPDLRSPQLPYLKLDSWTCERRPEKVPAVILESEELRATITPQFGGKIWGMLDKVHQKEFFYKNDAHQPANIGARAAWAAGGLEFNWSPGYLGHSAFTEETVWVAKISTEKGDVVRAYEFDRYNGTVWQVDMLLFDGALWTHTKVTNPTSRDLPGYWWTCAAHVATPESRILAPAEEVTVETYVGSSLRNAPWPAFENGMLNSTFGGLGGARLTDSSYLGNIAYTGDYFLRIPDGKRRWIAHQDGDGYVAVHGHPMNGTKFFTWGQSGPGRFMQDFLAGGEVGAGYYTELQSGIMPTQQQVFTLAAKSKLSFTEYYKGFSPKEVPKEYRSAVDMVASWWDGPSGIAEQKVAEMDNFFADIEDRQVDPANVFSVGSPWGALQEQLCNCTLALGAHFGRQPDDPTTRIWSELVSTGGFSAKTLTGIRTPPSYAVDPTWGALLEASAAKGSTWLHDLLLAVAYMEAGEVERPRQLLLRSLDGSTKSPVAARCLAVLSSDPEAAWLYFEMAWRLALEPGPASESNEDALRLRLNLLGEQLLFLLGNMGSLAFTGQLDSSDVWLGRLRQLVVHAAKMLPEGTHADLLLVAQVVLLVADGHFDDAVAMLAGECFPTLSSGRVALLSLWHAAVEGRASSKKGGPLLPSEAHRARKDSPVPRNIGCPYASMYCEEYW